MQRQSAARHVTLTALFPRLTIVAVVGIPVIMNVKYVGSIKSVAAESTEYWTSLRPLDRLHGSHPEEAGKENYIAGQ